MRELQIQSRPSIANLPVSFRFRSSHWARSRVWRTSEPGLEPWCHGPGVGKSTVIQPDAQGFLLDAQSFLRRGETQLQGFGDRPVGDAALMHVEAVAQMLVLRQRAPHALVGK